MSRDNQTYGNDDDTSLNDDVDMDDIDRKDRDGLADDSEDEMMQDERY